MDLAVPLVEETEVDGLPPPTGEVGARRAVGADAEARRAGSGRRPHGHGGRRCPLGAVRAGRRLARAAAHPWPAPPALPPARLRSTPFSLLRLGGRPEEERAASRPRLPFASSSTVLPSAWLALSVSRRCALRWARSEARTDTRAARRGRAGRRTDLGRPARRSRRSPRTGWRRCSANPPPPRTSSGSCPTTTARAYARDRRCGCGYPTGVWSPCRSSRTRTRRSPRCPGTSPADGLTWAPDDPRLALAAKYTVDVVALDGQGRRSARHTTFTTYVPEERFIGYVTPENRSTVGTGMIVSLAFDREIENRCRRRARDPHRGQPRGRGPSALVRQEPRRAPARSTGNRARRSPSGCGCATSRRRRGSTDSGPDLLVHHRTQPGLAGGRAAHTMEVRRDGDLLATVPITAGAPKRTTYNGKMVVMEMLDVTRINGRHGRLRRRVRRPGHTARDAPHRLRDLGAPATPGPRRLRQQQRQPAAASVSRT